ncbi:hypothetical protein [Streptomyces microflavus]|uniref:hypothetical protein n=1 Tax=Streptomyces microflavus TaxID=1919 RepID=UPI0036462E60
MSTAKGIGPEAAAYAAALRAAVHGFTGRGGTQKEIAHSVHVSPAALSRYLSGERIAPSSIVAALDAFLTQRGRPLEAGARAQLDELCGLAHEASGSPAVQLAHLKEELARVQAEKKVGKAELAALQEHSDQLTDRLQQALDETHRSEMERLALEEQVAGQKNSLQHAQAYTRQLQADLTALQEQVVLIQREVKVLRDQNKHLIEDSTGAPDSGRREKTAVPGVSTQATSLCEATSRSSGSSSGGGKKRAKPREKGGKARPAPAWRNPFSRPLTQVSPPQPTMTFSVSWTGNEDPRTFLAGEQGRGSLGILLGLFFAWISYGHQEASTVWVFYVIGGVFVVWGALLIGDLIPPIAVKKLMSSRSLRLDDTGLTTKDAFGEQHFSWASINRISVHHARQGIKERVPLALHLQLHSGSKEGGRTNRPAGWPPTQTPPAACTRPPHTSLDEWVPVCVLGPLTGADKTDLQNTITHYLKEPPEGIW